LSDLTTVEAVKAYAGVTVGGDDQAIAGIVSAVSGFMHGVIGHDYEGEVLTGEHHSGSDALAIVLDKPAASVQAVRDGTTTLAASTYELQAGRLLYRLASGVTVAWAPGVRNIEVDYTTTEAIPSDLELAARELAAFMVKQGVFSEAGGGRMGLAAQANPDSGAADYFVQAISQLPFASLILKRYRAFA